MFEINEKDLHLLSCFIEERFGIKMPPSKKNLLQTRLQKRVMQLGYDSIHQYLEFLFSPKGLEIELDHFATIISTHKTEFFRENEHFEIMRNLLLPELVDKSNLGKTETFTVWSSASSTGEEVYSIAISVFDYLITHGNVFPLFKVIGTDISDNIVEFARKGIYCDKGLSSIPLEYRHYIMKSKDPMRHEIRVVPEVRHFTDFRRQNLMDKQYKVKKGFHIIFCRNVLIYFDKTTQEMILHRIVDLLAPGGFLLVGHSESLSGIDLPLEQVQMTVFRKVKE